MKNETLHIIGAGIGGLALALGLLRAGRSVKVYEQAPELGEVGAGLSITPNAALGLEYLDMLDFMDAESNTPLIQYTHHGLTHEDLVVIDRHDVREQYGAAYYQLHRADFHSEFVRRIKALDPDCILLNYKLLTVKKSESGVQLLFENGHEVKTPNLIGADGVRSVVRDALFEDCTPDFTGHMAWRGLIPASELPSWFVEPASHVWIAPGLTCVTYPVRGQELVNMVAFARAPRWTEEGWSVRAEPNELKEAFVGFHELPKQLIAAVPGDNLFRWGLFARAPLESLVKGNIALIGDAAHPMLPYFGQGASSAIEDGVVLSRCLANSPDVKTAFKRYNAARIERVSFLQRESNLGGERLQGLDPYVLRDNPPKNEDALGIFRYNPATTSI